MLRSFLLLLASAALAGPLAADAGTILHAERSAPGDLEVSGEIAGLPPGTTRFVRYEELLRLPQETYTVSDDSNFQGKTEIQGVALSSLAKIFGKSPDDLLIVAICYDQYRTNYPRDYINAHHPLLVLRINGQLRDHWPPSEYGGSLGPYLISHPFFKPSFKVLSHEDEPQIPFGVTRIELRREPEVFGAIRPVRHGARTKKFRKVMLSHGRIAFVAITTARRAARWLGTRGCNLLHAQRTMARASDREFAIRHR